MYIPDPTERMERSIESQIDLVKEDETYPCCYCGKYYDANVMHPISSNPDAPLECGRCEE